MKRLLAILSFVVVLTSIPLCAQNTSLYQAADSVAADQIKVHEHSARTALLLSIVPGGGQIYNRQAWKLPIIYGAFAGMGYLVYDNYTNMRLFKEEYLHRVKEGSPELVGYTSYPNSSIYNMYQSYSKNFQLMIIITAGIYGLNLIDAYVFGHLFDFQITDDLSMNLSPMLIPNWGNPLGFSPSLGISLIF